MLCVGCGHQSPTCVACPAAGDCPDPVCLNCARGALGGAATAATYSHIFEGERFQLLIGRDDHHQRQLIELGLRVSFALAQENESSASVRRSILAGRFEVGS